VDSIPQLNGLKTLPPWDANTFFATPKETSFIGGGGGSSQSLIGPNPNRVALIFGCALGTKANISTGQLTGNAFGLTLSPGQNPFVLTHADVGPLVAVEWFIWSIAGVNVNVIEIILNRWPE
jgi:hypothetical protein